MLLGHSQDGLVLSLNLDKNMAIAVVGALDVKMMLSIGRTRRKMVDLDDTVFHVVEAVLGTTFGTDVAEHAHSSCCLLL